MPRSLRVIAHDLDSGEQVLFGSAGYDHVPVTRACIASMSLPPLYSPVRIGTRQYIDAGSAQVAQIDVAAEAGADVVIVVNSMVPVVVQDVPTGHGPRSSLRDKGMIWVLSQANRISVHRLMQDTCARYRKEGRVEVILIEPDATDGIFFMHNPASFSARRAILEYAYRATRARVARWFAAGSRVAELTGWHSRSDSVIRAPGTLVPGGE
jgi:NTE family protein